MDEKAAGSAAALREAKTFREMLHSRFTNTGDGFKLHDKLETYKLIDSSGGVTPRVYGRYEQPEKVPFSKLPDRFVLKPSGLAASRGVFVLNKIAGNNGYWDSMSKRRVWASGVVQELTKWSELHNIKSKTPLYYIAEELVVGSISENKIPYDYKFYTFNGAIGFILQIDRNPKPYEYHFYDGEFNSLIVGRDVILGSQPLTVGPAVIPLNRREMSDMAKKVSAALSTPFVSVDMFDARRGPVIGELTTGPGGPYFGGLFKFGEEFDGRLAAEWRRACDDLGQSYPLIRSGDKIPKTLHYRLPARL